MKKFETRQSWINNLNPTLKVGILAFLMVLTFLPAGFFPLMFVLITLIVLFATGRIPTKKLKPIFKLLLTIFIFVFIINWLVSKTPGAVFDLSHTRNILGWSWDELVNKGWVKKTGDIYWASSPIWGGWVAQSITNVKPLSGAYVEYKIGETVWYLSYYAPWYALSNQVVISSLTITTRLFCMMMIFSILVNTTSTIQLAHAFENIFTPLKIFKAPVVELSIIIALAIKFVPNLLQEANKLKDAQASRGLDFRNGNIITKIKALISLVVPMFNIAFIKADQLSDAMEARNFNPSKKRTMYKLYKINVHDWFIFISFILLIALYSCLVAWKVIISPTFLIDCFM